MCAPAAALCLAIALALPHARETAQAGPSYPLYYAFEIPPLLTGYEMNDQQERRLVYTGVLRGTLGGLPVQKATIALRPGASAGAGGGDFSLQTAAGPLSHGLILMTTDKGQTSLWFSGMYLGERIAFRVAGPSGNLGVTTFAAKGLADSTFADHSNYVAAVTQAVSSLAPAARAEAVSEADRNVGLVAAYRQQTGTP